MEKYFKIYKKSRKELLIQSNTAPVKQCVNDWSHDPPACQPFYHLTQLMFIIHMLC